MREAVVDVHVDHFGLVKRQLTFAKDRHFTVRIEGTDIDRLEHVNILNLELAALFEKHEAAAVRERAGHARVKHHHKILSFEHTVDALFENRRALDFSF